MTLKFSTPDTLEGADLQAMFSFFQRKLLWTHHNQNNDALIEAEKQRRIYPTGYRRRIGQSMPAAAAEYLTRKRYGLWCFDDLSVDWFDESSATGEFLVQKQNPVNSRLIVTTHTDSFFTTCRSIEKSSPFVFQLESNKA